MRPRQWVKNAFVLPALLFSKHVFEGAYLERCIGAVLCFCLLSGVVYLLNDIFDREQDRLHPEKWHFLSRGSRHRCCSLLRWPFPSGCIPILV